MIAKKTAKQMCVAISKRIKPHVDDLDYFADHNPTAAIEGWLKVYAVIALWKRGYTSVQLHGEDADLTFLPPGGSKDAVELKAFTKPTPGEIRNSVHKGAKQYPKDGPPYVPCLFLGRWKGSRSNLVTELAHKGEFCVLDLRRVGNSLWWVGVIAHIPK